MPNLGVVVFKESFAPTAGCSGTNSHRYCSRGHLPHPLKSKLVETQDNGKDQDLKNARNVVTENATSALTENGTHIATENATNVVTEPDLASIVDQCNNISEALHNLLANGGASQAPSITISPLESISFKIPPAQASVLVQDPSLDLHVSSPETFAQPPLPVRLTQPELDVFIHTADVLTNFLAEAANLHVTFSQPDVKIVRAEQPVTRTILRPSPLHSSSSVSTSEPSVELIEIPVPSGETSQWALSNPDPDSPPPHWDGFAPEESQDDNGGAWEIYRQIDDIFIDFLSQTLEYIMDEDLYTSYSPWSS